MSRSRSSLVLSSTLISLLLVLTGCASSPQAAPTNSPTQSDTATPTPTVAMKAYPQYWVGDTARGFRLYREYIRLEVKQNPIAESLTALFNGKPMDADYSSFWNKDTKVNSVVVVGDKAIVDLTLGKLNVGAEGESMAIAQLVWTATGADTSIKRVQFTVDGKLVESFAGHVDTTKPFTRGPSYEVLAPVWITSPEDGAQVKAQGFTLSGMASTFEANVAWKVFQNGALVKQGSTTAREAAPAWKPWSVAIAGLAPGKYVFIAMEYSAKDGKLVAQDTKSATLT